MKKKLLSCLMSGFILMQVNSQEVDEMIINDAGIEQIIIEKSSVTNTTAINNVPLLGNCYVYRIFLDMKPGYKMVSLGGYDNLDLLSIETTSASGFYNNTDFGGADGASIIDQLTVIYPELAYDSYLTDGRIGTTHSGVLMSVNSSGRLLGNVNPNDMIFMSVGTVEVLEINGATSTIDRENVGLVTPGGWQGPDPETNILYIGQLTTPGIMSFNLNFEINNPLIEAVRSSNHRYSSDAVFPSVDLSSPENGSVNVTGALVNLSANASDADGSIAHVEFFIKKSDALYYTSTGIDNSSPYQAGWTPIEAGLYDIKAVATDNDNFSTASELRSVQVLPYGIPVVTFISPSSENDTVMLGVPVEIEVDASAAHYFEGIEEVIFTIRPINDAIADPSIHFFDTVNVSPYRVIWTPDTAVTHRIEVIARDALGTFNEYTYLDIQVDDNLPLVSVISPLNGDTVFLNQEVLITVDASAEEYGGTISKVEFFAAYNGGDFAKIGQDATEPFELFLTPTEEGYLYLKVVATDNFGHSTSTLFGEFVLTVVQPTSIERSIEIAENSLSIYPNPVRSVLTIEIDRPTGINIVPITVYDLLGNKLLYSELPVLNHHTRESIDLSALDPGIYLLKVSSGYGIQTLRFIKE